MYDRVMFVADASNTLMLSLNSTGDDVAVSMRNEVRKSVALLNNVIFYHIWMYTNSPVVKECWDFYMSGYAPPTDIY